MSIKCDVLVVGGGPAGCSAARAASINGAKTTLIEKKEEIGHNIKCAEGIGEYLFPYLPFKIPKEQLIWKIDGMFFWTDEISIERTGGFWKAYSVDRSKFDKWISKLAIDNGAEVLTSTELIDLKLDEENNVKKAIVKRDEKLIEISPKVIVAADGVESTVLNLLGLYNPKRGDIAEVYSWEMKNLDLYKPQFEQVFTGEFTPSGYAYIFPKGKNVANIGVGGIYPEKKLELYFEELLEIPHVKKQVKNAEYVVEKTKKAVWNDLTEKWLFGNILLTGDVANQNLKPFIEGILPAVICGDISGKIANEISHNKKVRNEQYIHQIKKILDIHFEISKQLQNGLNYLFAKKGKEKYLQFFGIVTELFKPEEIEEIEKLEYEDLKSKFLELRNAM